MPPLLTTQYFDHANFQQRNQLYVFFWLEMLTNNVHNKTLHF